MYSTRIGLRLIKLHFVDISIHRFSKKEKLMIKGFKLLCSKQSLRTGKVTYITKYHAYFQLNGD